jgi:DNA-directed RNA polymerase specialized sigma subunit
MQVVTQRNAHIKEIEKELEITKRELKGKASSSKNKENTPSNNQLKTEGNDGKKVFITSSLLKGYNHNRSYSKDKHQITEICDYYMNSMVI